MGILHSLDWILPWRTPALTSLAFGLSWLGYSTFIMFFMAVGYWALSKDSFFRVMLLITFSAVLNAYAKDLFQSPRPPLAMRLDDLVGESYGLPSGHAQLAVVIWMWLAYEVRRTWIWIVCSLITLGVILSRVYLGAHDLEDVLVGALIGAATLVGFALIKDRNWIWQTDPTWSLILVWLVTAATLAAWPGTATPPRYVPLLAGWTTGAIVGLGYEERVLGFAVSPLWSRRALAAVVGIACFLALQKLLGLLGSALSMPPFVWEAAKGLIYGSFIAVPMPWLLATLRLVSARQTPHGVRF